MNNKKFLLILILTLFLSTALLFAQSARAETRLISISCSFIGIVNDFKPVSEVNPSIYNLTVDISDSSCPKFSGKVVAGNFQKNYSGSLEVGTNASDILRKGVKIKGLIDDYDNNITKVALAESKKIDDSLNEQLLDVSSDQPTAQGELQNENEDFFSSKKLNLIIFISIIIGFVIMIKKRLLR